jgi:queuine tRNA-ribosyltransferase
MGVGTPANLLECISMGVDMFDCVLPSRNARHGMLFTSEGIINIKNAKWEMDFSPLDSNGTAYVDKVYTKSYLRHLIKSKENLGIQIATIHNLAFYLELMREARVQILANTFTEWKNRMIPRLKNRL